MLEIKSADRKRRETEVREEFLENRFSETDISIILRVHHNSQNVLISPDTVPFSSLPINPRQL